MSKPVSIHHYKCDKCLVRIKIILVDSRIDLEAHSIRCPICQKKVRKVEKDDK